MTKQLQEKKISGIIAILTGKYNICLLQYKAKRGIVLCFRKCQYAD